MARCIVIKALSHESQELGGETLFLDEFETLFLDGFGISNGRYTNLKRGLGVEPNTVVVSINALPEGTSFLRIHVE